MRISGIGKYLKAAALRAFAAAIAVSVVFVAVSPAQAQQQQPETFRVEEIIDQGHALFGSISRGLALTVQEAFKRWGEPNGYILGQEASGAFIGGLRYGEGVLYTRNAGNQRVFWQGPTIGIDFGGDGARTMMLVYHLPSTDAMYQRFGGMDGSAYLVGGFGMTALTANNIIVVPIRSGVGARLGVNIGYLKFTPQPTWNPF
ncbi:MAG: DUF1134 domain-containing protein [Salinarimonadaceae bacterium]|nr:MAG: DUF1134 domain-containing protein [Salinarimonadaceae bacterium]